MKKGVLAVVMAAVAALFLVEVSMENLFIHRRLRQTMAPAVQESADGMAVAITDQDGQLNYLLICGRKDNQLLLCSLEPKTELSGTATLSGIYAQSGIRGLMSSVSGTFGVKCSAYLTVDLDGLSALVDAMGGIPVESGQGSKMISGQQAIAMLNPAAEASGHPELSVLSGMLKAIGSLPKSRLPALALQGMKLVKTNVSLKELLGQGISALSGQNTEVSYLALPGEIPAVWSGSGENRRCSYDLGQAATEVQRFFAGK